MDDYKGVYVLTITASYNGEGNQASSSFNVLIIDPCETAAISL